MRRDGSSTRPVRTRAPGCSVHCDSRRRLRVVVLCIVKPPADWIPPHQVRVVRLRMSRIASKSVVSGSSHASYLIRRHDDGHSVVDVGNQRIRGRRQDGATLDDLPIWAPPLIPEPGKRKDLALAYFKTIGLLHRSHSTPFIESICGDKAASPQDRISKCWRRCHSLRASVKSSIPNARVFSPRRDKSPAHRCEAANFLTVHMADGENRLCRRDVVSRMIVKLFGGLKTLRQILLRARQSVSVAHSCILTDSACELVGPPDQPSVTGVTQAASVSLALGRSTHARFCALTLHPIRAGRARPFPVWGSLDGRRISDETPA